MRNVQAIANGCERFLTGHGRRTVRERVQAVADSPLSLIRNDQYGQGGFLAEFEREIAELLGQEAAVFMPSGTMAQPIALRIWSDRAGCKTVAFHPTCHLEIHEHHAYRELHGLRAILLGEADRLFTLEDLRAVDEPVPTLLIELPQREIGGQLPSWDELVAICDEARLRGMRLHLDGARLWECAPFYGREYREIAGLFDSVYVSFYKILDGLPGAALAGPAEFIAEARIWQRRQGGNLQQQAASAISAKLGMERHLPRMGEYAAKAAEVAEVLRMFEGVRVVPERPPTNMMHVYFEGDPKRLTEAALTIAEEDKVALFFGLPTSGKLEFVVGESTLGFGRLEIQGLFEKLFRLARLS
ncbi:hypothetical protein EON82_17885 [bacterium]|nr:MAG: hypothetical protein EON82_17885 [bacterium]